jgi:CheY-like chemotaxis protein
LQFARASAIYSPRPLVPFMPHILSVSYDATLLRTRQLLLESRGYVVTSAEGYVEAISKCSSGNYDLLIIGHSIPHADKKAIVTEAKQHGSLPVLALLRVNEPELENASESVDVLRPEVLLDAVERLAPLNQRG